jgi:hypothetical protein
MGEHEPFPHNNSPSIESGFGFVAKFLEELP